MKQCHFCGASLPAEAGFCGICGRVSSQGSEQGTHVGDIPTIRMEGRPDENSPTLLAEQIAFLSQKNPPSGPLRPVTLVPMEDEEEKERRRRALVLGLGLPLLAPPQGPTQIPTIQGAPQIAQIPTIQGAPYAPGPAPALPNPAPQQLVLPRPAQHHTHHPHHGHHGHHGPTPKKPPTGSGSGLSGCLTVSAIIVAAALIILASVVGLGLTIWTPNLSLSGNSTVVPGGSITLHGSNFLPNSTVTLTLDNGIPLLYAQRAAPPQLASEYTQHAASAGLLAQTLLSPRKTNAVAVGGDGSFTVTIHTDPTLQPGQHTIHASESLSHRSAALNFTISQPGVTPGLTPTLTPGVTPQPSTTPTPSPTSAPPAPTLSCASPGALTLGPVSELSSQVATGNVTLCTTGFGQLTWNASWDQNQAPWLQLAQSSGTIQAPNQGTVSVSASAANLAAGTYNATVTFTDQANNAQTVNITLTVKTGCVNTTPPRLAFVGVENYSDPGSQNISITNCGLTSDWSASISQNNWLSISPAKGTLKNGATGTITVTASNLKAGLKAGSYQDTIVVKIGSQSSSIAVILTVQPPPSLQLSTNALSFSVSCFTPQPQSITITNAGGGTLKWSAGQPSQSWLTITSAAGGGTPGTLILGVNASGLSNGAYTATVIVTGSDKETQTVTVTLTVSSCIQ